MLANKSKPRLTVVPTKYSQSTPTAAHLFQKETPYSPTESTTSSFISSISGLAEKSASELGSLLKGAYRSLREKEKNLVLAAEIGKSLLEHNQTLKSDYDKLLHTIKNCEIEAKRPVDMGWFEAEDSMRLVSAKKAYEAMIDTLECKNAEVQETLEQTQKQAHLDNQMYSQRQRKLETEIEILQGNLDIAAQKVHELEECNQMQLERAAAATYKDGGRSQRRNEDLALMEELTVKMEELFIENKHLYMSKKSVEDKLLRSLADLDHLRLEFESLELTQQRYEALLTAFEAQKVHIRELNDSLEDHRLILARWRDKGVWSPQRSPATSESCHHAVTPPITTQQQQQHLFGELEKAWTKKNGLLLTKSQSDTNLSTKDNEQQFYNAPDSNNRCTLFNEVEHLLKLSNRNCMEHQYDLFEPEGNGSVYAERDLYPKYHQQQQQQQQQQLLETPKKGLLNLIQFQVRYMFHSLLRWCRFTIVLTAAVFINLWKGPELLKHM